MMNNSQMAMAGMSNVGGPVGGAIPMVNATSRSGFNVQQLTSLNTYIYDYLIRQGFYDVARAMLKARDSDISMPLQLKPDSSPASRGVNGVDGTDLKDDVKKPLDLPEPGNNIGAAESCFLEDWWCQFWELHAGVRAKNSDPAVQGYINANQNNQMMRQRRQNELVNNPMMYNNRMPNGMPHDMRQAMMMGKLNQQQQQQLAQMPDQMRRQLMQRQGQNPNMGEPRSQSPNGNGDAPSPKRQRMEGAFNGQVNGPAGRGQGMPGQQNMAQNNLMLQNAMPNNFNPQMAEQMKMQQLADGSSPMPPGANNGDGGNHALQDYQMQLMLLEQQNKKRLLMARQEQDNLGPGQQGQIAQFVGASGMSPSNSRNGPSPNPADQMKRGTPQLSKQGLPPGSSPANMEAMQNRGSPAPGFDPNGMQPGMQQQFFQNMNPQMAAQMGRPPSSHPGAFPQQAGMTPQQFEMMQRQRQAGQPVQPGMMAGQPGQPMGQQPGQPPQPMGTPRQPQGGNMPPPPAPATQNEQKTNPSSPSQNGQAAPPTPSQTKGNLPKGNKKEKAAPNKKAGNKKNQQITGATPASEAEPPTPTPSTPIIPMHPQSFNKKAAQQPPNANANIPAPANAPNPGNAVPGPQNPTPQGSGTMDGAAPFDTSMDGNGMSLEFAELGSGDVLDSFDFDTFLNNTDENAFTNFDMDFDQTLMTDG